MTASEHHESALEPHGLRAITDYLDGEGVLYAVVEHAATETAATEARAAHVPPDRMAKTVVATAGSACLVAVIPASRRLDLGKLHDVLASGVRPRLATEREIAERFPRMDVGAIPPVGPMLVGATVVDARLLEQRGVLCSGGDHRHALRLDPRDIVRLTEARIADVSRDWDSGAARLRS